MESKRPRLDDPKEWNIIREIYFGGNDNVSDDIEDTIEQLERQESKLKNINNNSR